MPKMTQAQAKKRLNEAKAKVKAVYVSCLGRVATSPYGTGPVHTADMAAIEKILNKCLKRLN